MPVVVVVVEEESLSAFGEALLSFLAEVGWVDPAVAPTISAEVVSTVVAVSLLSVVVDAIWLFNLMQDLKWRTSAARDDECWCWDRVEGCNVAANTLYLFSCSWLLWLAIAP